MVSAEEMVVADKGYVHLKCNAMKDFAIGQKYAHAYESQK